MVSVTKSKSYGKSNIFFEITLKNYSTITSLGNFDPLKKNIAKKISFKDIPTTKGFVSTYRFQFLYKTIIS